MPISLTSAQISVQNYSGLHSWYTATESWAARGLLSENASLNADRALELRSRVNVENDASHVAVNTRDAIQN